MEVHAYSTKAYSCVIEMTLD